MASPVPITPTYDPPRTKTPLDVTMQVAQTVGGILTPVILAALTLSGNMFAGASTRKATLDVENAKNQGLLQLEEEKTRARILDAAIAVLKTPPDKCRPEFDRAARDWAVGVMNGYKVINSTTPAYMPGTPIPLQSVPATGNAAPRAVQTAHRQPAARIGSLTSAAERQGSKDCRLCALGKDGRSNAAPASTAGAAAASQQQRW
jgi:hypothetical protein